MRRRGSRAWLGHLQGTIDCNWPLYEGAAGYDQASYKGQRPVGATARKGQRPVGAIVARRHDRLRPTCKGRLPTARLQGGGRQRLALLPT
ncbi:hypothetical protein B296_00041434 [Ensete ventricosum]|uniref:Uncharacterized protein n=1 Tax=Ensete ventricosum TaxID=4639 RepID=A0A426YPC7_ENSVE|nr:hypothetical protein B296_00041434 [Ensete ventricosum]